MPKGVQNNLEKIHCFYFMCYIELNEVNYGSNSLFLYILPYSSNDLRSFPRNVIVFYVVIICWVAALYWVPTYTYVLMLCIQYLINTHSNISKLILLDKKEAEVETNLSRIIRLVDYWSLDLTPFCTTVIFLVRRYKQIK